MAKIKMMMIRLGLRFSIDESVECYYKQTDRTAVVLTMMMTVVRRSERESYNLAPVSFFYRQIDV